MEFDKLSRMAPRCTCRLGTNGLRTVFDRFCPVHDQEEFLKKPHTREEMVAAGFNVEPFVKGVYEE